MQRFWTAGGILVAMVVALGTAMRGPPARAQAQPLPPPVYQDGSRTPAPALTLAPDFRRDDLSGNPVHLGDYRGKVVLLSFWATWCAPCLAEAPRFSAWQKKYGSSGLQVLGVSMDDDPALVRSAYRKYRFAYPVVMGDAHLGELYGGVLGLPLSYLIDPSGRIVARYQGEPELPQIERRIRTLLRDERQ